MGGVVQRAKLYIHPRKRGNTSQNQPAMPKAAIVFQDSLSQRYVRRASSFTLPKLQNTTKKP